MAEDLPFVVTAEEKADLLAKRKEQQKHAQTMIRARTAKGDEVEGPLGELWPWVQRTFGLTDPEEVPDEDATEGDEGDKPKAVMKFGRRIS